MSLIRYQRGEPSLKIKTIILLMFLISNPLGAEISGDIEYGEKLANEASSPLILQILLYKYLDSPKQLLKMDAKDVMSLKLLMVTQRKKF